MALRLTTNSLPAVDHVSDEDTALAVHRAETAVVTALIGQAAAALALGDMRKYLGFFKDAGELESPHRRYQTTKLLLEAGLASLQNSNETRAAETLVAMAHGAIERLEAEPAEPVLLTYAGVIIYELWALDAARALFLASQRLDPDQPHLQRNLSALKARTRAKPNTKLAKHPVMIQLAKRAKRVAQRAQPATGQRLSLCMIVRDEEEMLPRSLEAIADAVDEIIIVDTGSQDRTIEIAREYGATVIEREWTGSFSDARNASLEAATGDWFLYLDADEVLVTEDVKALRGLLGQTWREAFYLHETNFTGNEESGVSVVHSALRLLRNRPNYRFSGRLHEQIAIQLPGFLPERIVQSPVRVNHYGYLGVVRESKDKSRRNIELLLAQERDGSTNAFFHYNLGSEYFAAGEIDRALEQYEQANTLIEQAGTISHEFLPSLTVRWVKSLRAAGRNEDALERAGAGLDRFPGFTDLVYEQALASITLAQTASAVAYLEQAIEMGDAPSKYTAMVGAGTFMPRIVLATLHLNRREAGAAIELLQWCTRNHPEHLGTIHPYATALLQSGQDGETVAQTVELELEPLTSAGRFMLGTALFERGYARDAETQFRRVLERQPHSGAAGSALAETLMYQRRYAEAATVAASIVSDGGIAAVALRTELFGRLLDGDLVGTDTALAGATASGLPDHEQALFARWLARERGERHAPAPLSAIPLLSRMLESLLRVQDFQNFESLVGLLAETTLPERERQELLAQMYLRRGFLKSAGREWMSACEQTPDARSLVGLAQVALANGQAETAITFADQALALDPENLTARRLAEGGRQRAAA